MAAFYRDVALLGAAGPVRLLGLSVDGQWAATFYGLVHHGSFHGILVGMDGDERWRGTSPGLLIVVEAMRWARRHGLSYLDLTVGDLDYKERMGAQTSDLHEIAEALTWWGAAILHAGRVVAVCRTWLRGHPELFERLRALRRSIRKWRERSIQ